MSPTNSGKDVAESLPPAEVNFDEESEAQMVEQPAQSSVPRRLRWQDRLLWAWPALIIVAMAVASRWGPVGVLAAGIGGTATVAAVTGGEFVKRMPMLAVLSVVIGLLVVVFMLGSFGVFGTPRVSLANAGLKGANLAGTNLAGADLHGADLRGANLSGADLRGADLTNACLMKANLSGAQLDGVNARGADVTQAIVSADAANHAKDWPSPGQKSSVC